MLCHSAVFPLGLGVPQRWYSLLRHWKLRHPSSNSFLVRSGSDFPSTGISEIVIVEESTLDSTFFIFQRRKHGSREAERFNWCDQQLIAGTSTNLFWYFLFCHFTDETAAWKGSLPRATLLLKMDQNLNADNALQRLHFSLYAKNYCLPLCEDRLYYGSRNTSSHHLDVTSLQITLCSNSVLLHQPLDV